MKIELKEIEEKITDDQRKIIDDTLREYISEMNACSNVLEHSKLHYQREINFIIIPFILLNYHLDILDAHEVEYLELSIEAIKRASANFLKLMIRARTHVENKSSDETIIH